MIDFRDLSYLKAGNPRQQRAYSVLTTNAILAKLDTYDPILVGTIPINIDIDTSDLDIICYWTVKQEFVAWLYLSFTHFSDFNLVEATISGKESVICQCRIEEFVIEIFGQPIPTTQQHAYKHMIIEYNLLEKYGAGFRQQIIELKNRD